MYNSQKLERTQMSLNGEMCTENVVYLHNDTTHQLKQWIREIFRQMVGTGKYHPKWGNPITKEYTWNAITDRWKLISPEALNTQDTISIPNDSHEEVRRGPWSWKGRIQHCRGVPGQRKRKEVIGEWVERSGFMGHMGRGDLGRGNHLECKQRISKI